MQVLLEPLRGFTVFVVILLLQTLLFLLLRRFFKCFRETQGLQEYRWRVVVLASVVAAIVNYATSSMRAGHTLGGLDAWQVVLGPLLGMPIFVGVGQLILRTVGEGWFGQLMGLLIGFQEGPTIARAVIIVFGLVRDWLRLH